MPPIERSSTDLVDSWRPTAARLPVALVAVAPHAVQHVTGLDAGFIGGPGSCSIVVSDDGVGSPHRPRPASDEPPSAVARAAWQAALSA
jgi:hypothetical protein